MCVCKWTYFQASAAGSQPSDRFWCSACSPFAQKEITAADFFGERSLSAPDQEFLNYRRGVKIKQKPCGARTLAIFFKPLKP